MLMVEGGVCPPWSRVVGRPRRRAWAACGSDGPNAQDHTTTADVDEWCRVKEWCSQGNRSEGSWGVRVAESGVEPPRSIPNRVVPGASAGEYCVGDCVGGEAVARTPQLTSGRFPHLPCSAGWSSGSSLGS